MLRDVDETLDLVGLFQDAALEPTLWPEAFDRLARAFDSPTSALTLGTADRRMLLLDVTTGEIPPIPDLDRLIAENAESDLRLAWGMAHPGQSFSCRQVLDGPTWEATPFYRNVLAPHGLAFSLFTVDRVDPQHVTGIWTMRGPGAAAYSTDEVKAFGRLAPHIVRAVRTQIRLGTQQGVGADLRAALDGLAGAVLLVDPSARIWFANRAAEALLTAADGLAASGGVLRAASPGDTTRLEALAAETVRAAQAASLPQADALTLSRPSGRLPLGVLCVPLRPDRLDPFPPRPSAMLFVSDPETRPPVPETLLARLYGLTPAEAGLCADLLRGQDVAGHAARRGVSLNTAKTHLRNAFAKTGTSRQADLLRLILTSPVGLAVLDGLTAPAPR